MRFLANFRSAGTQTELEQFVLLAALAFLSYVLCTKSAMFQFPEDVVKIANKHMAFEQNYTKNSKKVEKNRDRIGIILHHFTTTAFFGGILVPILFVYLNLDPFHFATFGLSKSPQVLDYPELFKWFRYVTQFVILASEVESLRCTGICVCCRFVVCQENLQRTFSLKLGSRSLQTYNQIRVIFSMTADFTKEYFKLLFTNFFVTFILFTTIVNCRKGF